MARRRYQRAGRRSIVNRESERNAYSTARNEFRNAVKKAQESSWKQLCQMVDTDPWGLPYRLVMKRLGVRRSIPTEREMAIAEALFPQCQAVQWAPEELQPYLDISMDELTAALLRTPRGKAPGPDYVPDEVLTRIVKDRPEMVLRMFNQCLKEGVFPRQWKRARLVLLSKGKDKPPDEPGSYRPLSLLSGTGKLLERLLLERINSHLTGQNSLSEKQYGFRRGKSTLDAIREVISSAEAAATGPTQDRDLCAVVAVDVRNAFNSAPWDRIDAALQRLSFPPYLQRILRSYMSDRTLVVGDSDEIPITCGVPQGSVIGPALWNIFYDDLLRLPLPEGVTVVGFADDIAIVIRAHNADLLEAAGNPALDRVSEWLARNGLRVAPQKSEAVVLTRKWAYQSPVFTMDGQQIQVKPAITYLGVKLDSRLNFTAHVQSKAAAARSTVTALGRLMPNVQGPSSSKRSLLMSVVNSKLLYAAPIWAQTISKTARNANTLTQVQRLAAIRVARCFRSVSDMAALVLARMIPAHLLGSERQRIAEQCRWTNLPLAVIKAQQRRTTMSEWQEMWTATTKGQWTKRMIPNVARWADNSALSAISYHMAQVLTGHGCFQSYLHSRKRALDAMCYHCRDPEDDVEHTVFRCPHWAGARRDMESVIGRPLQPTDIPEILLGPDPDLMPENMTDRRRIEATAKRQLDEFVRMVEAIMSAKEEAERSRQAATAALQQST